MNSLPSRQILSMCEWDWHCRYVSNLRNSLQGIKCFNPLPVTKQNYKLVPSSLLQQVVTAIAGLSVYYNDFQLPDNTNTKLCKLRFFLYIRPAVLGCSENLRHCWCSKFLFGSSQLCWEESWSLWDKNILKWFFRFLSCEDLYDLCPSEFDSVFVLPME